MPGRYTASPQSLYGQVGAPNPPRGGVDVASAIDAVTGGATSLIHATMARRNTENEIAARNAQIEQGRASLAFQQREADDRTREREQDFSLRKQAEDHRFLENGGIPAHPETQAVAGTAPVAAMNPMTSPSPIARAMTATPNTAPSATPAVPGVQVTPSANEPSPSAGFGATNTTVYHPETVNVGESYDPTRAGTYQRGMAIQDLRNQGYLTREDARGEMQREHDERLTAARTSAATIAQQGRVALEKMRESTKGSRIAGKMTGGQSSKIADQTADGLIGRFGNYDDAKAWIDSDNPEAVKLRGMEKDLPVSWHQYLDNAHTRMLNQQTTAAIRLQSGALGMEPKEAVGAVNATRDLVGTKKGAPATGAPPAPTSKGPAAAPPASTKDTSSSGDDFSDDEILAAHDAGKKSDAEIATYIKGLRTKKKPPVKQ